MNKKIDSPNLVIRGRLVRKISEALFSIAFVNLALAIQVFYSINTGDRMGTILLGSLLFLLLFAIGSIVNNENARSYSENIFSNKEAFYRKITFSKIINNDRCKSAKASILKQILSIFCLSLIVLFFNIQNRNVAGHYFLLYSFLGYCLSVSVSVEVLPIYKTLKKMKTKTWGEKRGVGPS